MQTTDDKENFKNYRILRRGDGSLWEISRDVFTTYKAVDTTSQAPVALYVALLQPELRLDAAAIAAAQSVTQLRHPNIASVYYFGIEDQTCLYAAEWVEGKSLDSVLGTQGPWEIVAALQIALQGAQALEAAQAVGITHGDITPRHIILADTPFGQRIITPLIKVTHFGLMAARGAVKFSGRPVYASPETIAGGPGDTRSDIYSLGVILWYLLAGKPPFDGETAQLLRSHVSDPPPFEQLPRTVPAPVRSLLKQMLAKEPADRFQTPTALRGEMEDCLAALHGAGDETSPGIPRTAIVSGSSVMATAQVGELITRASSVPPPPQVSSIPLVTAPKLVQLPNVNPARPPQPPQLPPLNPARPPQLKPVVSAPPPRSPSPAASTGARPVSAPPRIDTGSSWAGGLIAAILAIILLAGLGAAYMLRQRLLHRPLWPLFAASATPTPGPTAAPSPSPKPSPTPAQAQASPSPSPTASPTPATRTANATPSPKPSPSPTPAGAFDATARPYVTPPPGASPAGSPATAAAKPTASPSPGTTPATAAAKPVASPSPARKLPSTMGTFLARDGSVQQEEVTSARGGAVWQEFDAVPQRPPAKQATEQEKAEVQRLLSAAADAQKAGHAADAVESYVGALVVAPNFTRQQAGSSPYADRAKLRDMIVSTTQKLQNEPRNARAYYDRGNAYFALNDFERAIADFDTALQLDPKLEQAGTRRDRATRELAGSLPRPVMGGGAAAAAAGEHAEP